MGFIDKIKKTLFNEEEDKLVQDDRNLRSLNPNYNRNVTFTEPTPTPNNTINNFTSFCLITIYFYNPIARGKNTKFINPVKY